MSAAWCRRTVAVNMKARTDTQTHTRGETMMFSCFSPFFIFRLFYSDSSNILSEVIFEGFGSVCCSLVPALPYSPLNVVAPRGCVVAECGPGPKLPTGRGRSPLTPSLVSMDWRRLAHEGRLRRMGGTSGRQEPPPPRVQSLHLLLLTTLDVGLVLKVYFCKRKVLKPS